MKNYILLLAFGLFSGVLFTQPVEFEPAPCFSGTSSTNVMFYLAFLDQVGTVGNEEPVEVGVDWVAAIDAQGYVIGIAQVTSVSGAFGCPTSAAVNLAIAPEDNNPSSTCPAPPYGGAPGELMDIVIYDVSRGMFFTLGAQVAFSSGIGGTANSGGCPQENFTLDYTVPSNPLPVILSAFRAAANDLEQVELAWTTIAEQNSAFFEVERSQTGDVWRSIGRVNAAGNSDATLNYLFVDINPQTGQNLYRLRQEDVDGSFYYSSVVSVELGRENGPKEIEIFPNPLTGEELTLSLQGEWADNNASTTVYDLNGRAVFTSIGLSAGSNLVQLPELPAGVYQLVVTDGTTNKTSRLVIR